MVGATSPPISAATLLGDRRGKDDIDIHRHVAAMLLGGAERQEHGRAGGDPSLGLRPWQFGEEDCVFHDHLVLKASQRRHWRQGIGR